MTTSSSSALKNKQLPDKTFKLDMELQDRTHPYPTRNEDPRPLTMEQLEIDEKESLLTEEKLDYNLLVSEIILAALFVALAFLNIYFISNLVKLTYIITILPMISDIPLMILSNTYSTIMRGQPNSVKDNFLILSFALLLSLPNIAACVLTPNYKTGSLLGINILYFLAEVNIAMTLQNRSRWATTSIRTENRKILAKDEELLIEPINLPIKLITKEALTNLNAFTTFIKLRLLSHSFMVASSFVELSLSLDDDYLQDQTNPNINNLVNLLFFFTPSFFALLTIGDFNKTIDKTELMYSCSLKLKIKIFGIEVKYVALITMFSFLFRTFVS
jgi:hypothetical protein